MVTAGIYFLPNSIFDFVPRARARGFGALRAFLGGLLEWGVRLDSFEFNNVIDIDVAQDLEAARATLAQQPATPHGKDGKP
jgi:NDP-sugar pyrophosphorylase family protein